ncbi:SDR family NAD(P)-dependent oxidoreductase [Planosporangium mesophilum]|uniref:Short-chain dehydrogenase n=1 Tax=Planosporangium mesophilum TaxID=689768 RepID=A0A8J3T5A3_9ACTN|nr:SDR family NAD(P)-dependent oxidoreductase [Planosporangium mesophilum]NJC81557.1 SDR family NAD(P)-dependent oxidoreductase [Planosporangium mesophilum]GII20785.1 short-chain dehydrogenase [Planosporangium mesophilum]
MRSVVITGISRGLGAALFAELAGHGDRILGIGRRFADEQVALAVTHANRIRLYEAELADPTTLPTDDTLRDFLAGGDESVLIHNAGMVEPIGRIGELPDAAIVTAAGVNLTAPMLLTDAFMNARPEATTTRVLYVSSGAAHRVIEGWSVYSATKRGAEMFFDALAVEHPEAYVVNINPGVMDTGMQAAIRAAEFPDRDRFTGLHERGELPEPVDVARRIIAEHVDRPITRE